MKNLTDIKLKSILKFTKVAVISFLSVCGIFFIILFININMTGSHNGHTKQKRTVFHLARLDSSIAEYYLDLNQYPESLFDLYQDTKQKMWMGPYVKEKDLVDYWGVNYRYQKFPNRNGYQLYTLGSDNKLGGTEHAYDQISEGSLKFIAPPN